MTRRVTFLIIVIVLVAVAARALPGARTIDDAFITFRYSDNLLNGSGFVYNLNVNTLGTTTPLFTLIMAVSGAITGERDFQTYAIIISTLADAITCTLLFLIARRLIANDVIAALPGILWAISPMSVSFAVGGMETSINILWLVAAIWLYAQKNAPTARREIGIGISIGLGVLTRIDALLWIAPLIGWQLLDMLRQRKLPLRTWLMAALIIAPWAIFAWAQFGSPFPNSVSAKSVAYQMPPLSALIRLIQTAANPFFEFDTFGAVGLAISSIVYLFLSAFGVLYTARVLPRLTPFLVYAPLYIAAFAIANPLIFRWYLAPMIPPIMLAIILGVWLIVARPLRKTSDDSPDKAHLAPRVAVIVTAVIGAVWIFTSLNAWTLHPDHGLDRPAPRMAWHELELVYADLSTRLIENEPITTQTRVGAADIGVIGYITRATIVDTVGLVSPDYRTYYPLDPSLIADGQNYAIPSDLIRDTLPDYLIAPEGLMRDSLLNQTWFNDQYTLIDSVAVEFYGSSIQVYRRR